MIDILYFASVKERMGRATESMSIDNELTGEQLVALLSERGEPWQSVFADGKLLIAINQEMAGLQDPVRDGDEVAFFPPVTGG